MVALLGQLLVAALIMLAAFVRLMMLPIDLNDQAQSFSKVSDLQVLGLTSLTDEQAQSLSNVKNLTVLENLQSPIDKYKNP
jgi:hypothetical protein